MRFVDWDSRPAVILDSRTAVALLKPGGDWVESLPEKKLSDIRLL